MDHQARTVLHEANSRRLKLSDQEDFELGRTSSSPPPSPTMPAAPYADREGGATGGETESAGQPVADQAKDKAQEVAGQAQDKAQQAAGQARAQLRDQIEQRSSQAAEQMNQQASDLHTVSQSLREQGKVGPASAADRLAGYAERVGGYLDGKSADQLLRDAEDLARKRPWAAAGAGAALGLAASRFLKASSRERYATRSGLAAPASSLHGAGSAIGSSSAGSGASPVGVPAGVAPLGNPSAPLSGSAQTPGI
jgi:ElaB/YqjD/DUF883 family membrane-anchored ribosome-binding protein